MYNRKNTRTVWAGSLPIGGGHPVSVQSMTNTNTADAEATVKQIHALEEAGCELVRVAVPDKEAAAALPDIKKRISIPLAADIHYDWRLALMALDAGVDKLRLNPGNIGSQERIAEVVKKAAGLKVPIRIGVNGGSLEKRFLGHGVDLAEAMAESALDHIRILEGLEFCDIIVSMKASNVPATIRAHEILAAKVKYPMHIGITEAGTAFSGGIKSAAGIGALLSRGIGDTIRVSLSGDPVEEIRHGREILKAMELRRFGPEIISCPTCGRTSIDIAGLAERIEKAVAHMKCCMRISVMGCSVNGPGEAAHSDIGVTGGDGKAAIYRKGELIKTVSEAEVFGAVMEEITGGAGVPPADMNGLEYNGIL
ncbi:MAG: flavodoxin-dependent (E)-4-hydroxy-3-methylbut-2-enyl-diphosphate synthase [Defluviitaleaceae bacterium]|nr:flavodoxin-dependent (E)-4-hydroxy-3-methylbut-2-enyl-diphosphate synthase [Defluviitaleaceae bacterium]MCL2836529.1 flavodoxin-dependent (E)-4-hydroxy-3-methylbut-2-enyl-diphosphate synthase [Defluviitaleaceae bacterium]